jgi:hypothetical protein
MRRFQRAAGLLYDPDGFLNRELLLRHQLCEFPAIDEFHRDEAEIARGTQIEDADDVLVCDLAGEDEFLFEAVENPRLICQVRANHLQGDGAIQFPVFGLIRDTHAAMPEYLYDFVPACE